MNPKAAEEIIEKIGKDRARVNEYKEYWQDISPKNNDDILWRYVFSFLSVHTSWSTNVRGYNLLKANKEDWFKDKETLNQLIKSSGVGLDKNRTFGIWKFKEQFQTHPGYFKKLAHESWQESRNRIMTDCFGLGLAKTSFALELCFPLQAEVVCLDTHMLQLYGYSPKDVAKGGSSKKKYSAMESHWIEQCKIHDVPPVLARAIFWDLKQNKESSKYWTYVLEN